ncbi:MAG TPA: hypothetical protein DCK87_07390 [Desulfotomaculum sp.]|nr:hypothetical protein [Desulfotomaculum sp.]
MEIELEASEVSTIIDALLTECYFRKNLNQLDKANEARKLFDLMRYIEKMHVIIDMQYLTDLGRKDLKEILRKREAWIKSEGKIVEFYRPMPIDEDDPNEVSADRQMTRIVKEYAEEMKRKGKDKSKKQRNEINF